MTLEQLVLKAVVEEFLRQLAPKPAPIVVPVPSPAPPVQVARSGIDALNLIISEEVTGAKYYGTHYTHFDWPQGASGPTIGIGYDCGYCTHDEIQADWLGIIPASDVAVLLDASGLRGEAASAWVSQNRTAITVPYAAAINQFTTREIVKWERRVKVSLPNCDLLSPNCFGVLVSLAYNRGCSFDLPGARYAEMRAIKLHMQTKAFSQIPAELRSMKRLWPTLPGLISRRESEAKLFEAGLVTAVNT